MNYTYQVQHLYLNVQSCGTICQRQFVTRTVYTLLNATSNHTFLACVLMTDSVMPFRSGFAHGGH